MGGNCCRYGKREGSYAIANDEGVSREQDLSEVDRIVIEKEPTR
jgi:hypothetical protein